MFSRDGIHIAYEDLGEKAGPALVLLAGNGCSSVFWPDEFCRSFCAAGYRVIRFDYRDTGRSSRCDFKARPYTLDDLEADVLGLMDDRAIAKAHLVGLSMGGFLAQRIAIGQPGRALSLVSMMSTPDYDTMLHTFLGTAAPTSNLPPPSAAWLQSLAEVPAGLTPLELSVEAWRLANGPRAPFDRAYWRSLLETATAYGGDNAAAHHHRLACARSTGRNQCEALPRVAVPALFVHGSEDPIFPPQHSQRSAQLVPQARCLIVDGMGHALNPAYYPQITAAILETTRS